MEIVIAAVISLLTQFFKWMVGRFGKQLTKNAVVLFVLIVSVFMAYLKTGGYLTVELIQEVMGLLTMAVGFYEVVYKRVLKSIFEKLF